MLWGLGLVVVIGVGLPMTAWLITSRLPAPRPAATRLGVGYDGIDRWLLSRHQLPPPDRWRVRAAVFSGRRVSDAALVPAARDLAAQVLGGGLRVPRLSQVFGWVDLMAATGFAAAGMFLLTTSHHAAGLVGGVVSVINAGLFGFAGALRALRVPRQIRRNVAKSLQLNEDAG